ncbi:unnamed protein product [Pedinophyceae sp. YPF-701]|nr:unnamed protein product [Pedinophyceae sp. YPF-701]
MAGAVSPGAWWRHAACHHPRCTVVRATQAAHLGGPGRVQEKRRPRNAAVRAALDREPGPGADDRSLQGPPDRLARASYISDARRLNDRIVNAQDSEELLDLVILEGDSFTHINAVTAFNRLAKIVRQNRNEDPALIREDPRTKMCSDLVEARLPECNTQGLSNIIWAATNLQHASSSLLAALPRFVLEQPAQRWKDRELGIVVWGLAKMAVEDNLPKDPTRQLLVNLWPVVDELLPRMDPQAVFNVIWGYQALGAFDGASIARLGATATSVAPRASLRDLAGIALAMSRAGYTNDDLYAAISESATRQIEHGGKNVPPRQGRGRGRGRGGRGAAQARRRASTIQDVDLGNLASAFGRVYSGADTVAPRAEGLSAHVEMSDDLTVAGPGAPLSASWESSAHLPAPPPDHAVRLVRAISYYLLPSPWRRALKRRYGGRVATGSESGSDDEDGAGGAQSDAKLPEYPPHVASMRPQYLSNVLWAISSMGIEDSRLFEATAETMIDRLANAHGTPLPAQTIATFAWAFARQRHRRVDFLDALATCATALLNKYGVQTLRHPALAVGQAPNTPIARAIVGQELRRLSSHKRAFSEQATAMLAYAYAYLDCLGTTDAGAELAEALARALAPHAASLGPQSVSNLCWSFACAGVYPAELLPALKARAVELGVEDALLKRDLWQMYQAALAMRLEAPEMSVDVSGQRTRNMLGFLYSQGELAVNATEEWERGKRCEPRVVSAFQRDVYLTLQDLGVACELEYADAEYTMDIAIPAKRVAIEVDGPSHFCTNTRTPTGPTLMKRRLLRALGWSLVPVTIYEWQRLRSDKAKRRWLQDRLTPLLVDSGSPATTPPPAPRRRRSPRRPESDERTLRRSRTMLSQGGVSR